MVAVLCVAVFIHVLFFAESTCFVADETGNGGALERRRTSSSELSFAVTWMPASLRATTSSVRGVVFGRYSLYGRSALGLRDTGVPGQHPSIRVRAESNDTSSSSAETSSPAMGDAENASAASSSSKLPDGKNPMSITEGEWKTILSPEQFRILRQKGRYLQVSLSQTRI